MLKHIRPGVDCVYEYSFEHESIVPVLVRSIKLLGLDNVYDVQMDAPYHNFITGNGIVTGNSHSVAVALDAIYGAYLKAHYPLEYYTTLLDAYAEKGDKDRVALIKDEMKRGFGIRIVPCRFRQDNRRFSFDRAEKTISDALPSIRNLSMPVAEELLRMKDNHYDSFVDLLVDLDSRRPFNATNIEVLIMMDYFREFGHNGKLLAIWREFRSGDMAFKKTYVDATQKKRIANLKAFADMCADMPILPVDQLRFEAVHYGTPVSVFPQCKGVFAVLNVETKYSPKLTLYSAATGNTGSVKIRKSLYASTPVSPGDMIVCDSWENRPRYSFVDGKAVPIPGTKELWMTGYHPA